MAIFNVTTPSLGHTGSVGGVHFVDGKAEVDDEKNAAELAYFRAQGYGVEPVEPAKAEPKRRTPAKKADEEKTAEPAKKDDGDETEKETSK